MLSQFLTCSMLLAVSFFPGHSYAQSIRIVAIGDSNTAGFGVGSSNAFPAVLESALRSSGINVSIANQGISGDTTGGMLSRLDSAVPNGVRIAIVQGGYNDRHRGVPPEAVAANVDAILARLSARRVRVILCGLSGTSWSGIAGRRGSVLVPASTCYDANSRGLDRLHMNAAGHRIVAGRLAPIVKRILERS